MDELIKAVTAFVNKANSGEILLSLSVVFSVVGFLGFWSWKIAIPNAIAARESRDRLDAAVASLCPVVVEIHKNTGHSRGQLDTVHRTLRGPVLSMMEKLNKSHPEVDLDKELGEMKGCLGDGHES